jgi:hypothetical protein
MNLRTGTTLVEVLIAIFVMGIGMLALLTLFPLGALSMAQAIQDSRAAHAAANAAALAEARGIRRNSGVTGGFTVSGYFQPLANSTVYYDGPSFPVLVDPYGYYSGSPNWVTGTVRAFTPQGPFGAVARRSPSFIPKYNPAKPQPTTQAILKAFTLLDEIRFADSGYPDVSTGEIQREGIYSWAYLARRPRYMVASVVDLSVVVYSQRPLQSVLQPREDFYAAYFDNSRNAVTLLLAPGQTSSIRPGSWILDGTVEAKVINNKRFVTNTHGFFYRVEEVTETTFNNQPALELAVATPFREFPLPQPPNPYSPSPGMVFHLEGVVEVLEKGPGWLP